MRIGVVTSAFFEHDIEFVLATCGRLGIRELELCAGGFFPKRHCNPAALLADRRALSTYRSRIEDAGLTVCALAIHGEPLHPDRARADEYGREFDAVCELAGELGVAKLTLLAGLPGGQPGDMSPNWITQPFPEENQKRLAWQWEACVLPYWAPRVRAAESAGLSLCFELHPCDVVHNPSALLALRGELGPTIGANVDPSHLAWQGIDAREAILALGSAILHVHAKDVRVNTDVARRDGVLDPKPHGRFRERSWSFRTVGYGHDEGWWRDFVSTLRAVGYDDVLSIEHEDPLLEPMEGLERAVEFLRGIIPDRPIQKLWYE